MEWFIVAAYFLFLAFVIYRFIAPRFPMISKRMLLAIFLVKAVAGIYYGIWHERKCGHCDTFLMFQAGNYIFEQLHEDPVKYFRLTFGPNGTLDAMLSEKDLSGVEFWKNTASYTVVRFNALVRLISFGYYPVHSLVMAFLSFLALLHLFRFLYGLYPGKKGLFLLLIFFIPSINFYGSGVHKEAIALIALALVLPSFYQWMKGKRRQVLPFLASLFLLYLVKEFYFAALLPVLLAWGLSLRFHWKAYVVFPLLTGLVWFLFFAGSALFLEESLTGAMAEKQRQFQELRGESTIEIPAVNASLWSYIKGAPGALSRVLLRPFPGEIHNAFLSLYALENLFILLFTIWALLRPDRNSLRDPLFWFCLLFSLTAFLVIGSIVPNLGAISRYRSPGLLFYLIAWGILLKEGPSLRKLNIL